MGSDYVWVDRPDLPIGRDDFCRRNTPWYSLVICRVGSVFGKGMATFIPVDANGNKAKRLGCYTGPIFGYVRVERIELPTRKERVMTGEIDLKAPLKPLPPMVCFHTDVEIHTQATAPIVDMNGKSLGITVHLTAYCRDCGNSLRFVGIPDGGSQLEPRTARGNLVAMLPLAVPVVKTADEGPEGL